MSVGGVVGQWGSALQEKHETLLDTSAVIQSKCSVLRKRGGHLDLRVSYKPHPMPPHHGREPSHPTLSAQQ